jgi:hypothetical protein
MDPLGDPLTTRPIQMGWLFTIELYADCHFELFDNPDRRCANGSVCTKTWTGCDGPEPLLTLFFLLLLAMT